MDDNAVMEERRARRSSPGEAQIVAHARGGEALAGCLLRTMQRPHRAGERIATPGSCASASSAAARIRRGQHVWSMSGASKSSSATIRPP